MALAYNSDLSYNDTSLTYDGNIRILMSGISNPIEIGELVLKLVSGPNDSNSTITGVATIDLAPTGEIQFAVISTGPTANVTIEYV